GLGARLDKLVRSLPLEPGVGELSLGAQDLALGLLDGSLERSRLDSIERRACGDQVALLEQDLLEVARHARLDVDAVLRLNAADKARRLGDVPLLRENRPHRCCRAGCGLSMQFPWQGTQPNEQ